MDNGAMLKETLMNVWNSPSKYVLIVMSVFIIVYIPAMIFYMRKKKGEAADFLSANPNAAKVFMKNTMSGRMVTISVNDDAPKTFFEKSKQGIFVLPGENVIEAQYSWTRPGVMYKSVTTTVGPSKVKVAAEANKEYELGYDKKSETFTFEQIT